MTSSSGTEDNLTEYERMSIVLEQKKSLLTERKKRYSELTTLQYNANQELIRMQKALKNQTANISAATKKYVDINVNLALADADCEYFKNNLTSHSVGFDQVETSEITSLIFTLLTIFPLISNAERRTCGY